MMESCDDRKAWRNGCQSHVDEDQEMSWKSLSSLMSECNHMIVSAECSCIYGFAWQSLLGNAMCIRMYGRYPCALKA